MLQYTFRHIKGFGAKKEADFWRSQTYTWEDFEKCLGTQLSLFPDIPENVEASLFWQSKLALKSKDVEYFAKRLPHQEHFRIALTFPEETMFLDIETTGLSRYYDKITLIGWSLGSQYDVLLQGDSPTSFLKAIARAKAIVTFNGSLFDLPFLKNEFEKLKLPSCHIDLRFLSKRVDLTGGQKAIEEELHIKRPAKAAEVDGEKATLLWHKYKWGDIKALKQLIIYNHADVEGMKVIFDKVVKKILQEYKLPIRQLNLPNFSKNRSKIRWYGDEVNQSSGIRLRPFEGRVGPLIFFSDLTLPKNKPLKVVGIDLTGSEERPSGWCFLDHDMAITKCIGADEELIKETLKVRPDLVSIDSPLSIPHGRIHVGDDDPGRHEFGIMRFCERLLKKRGVNVYPSLIPSMQRLTARGMRLAVQFRQMGVPVIESYPGAAQDIMGIPRKGASLDYLAKGLELFGIKGEFRDQKVTHDELDAITSAVVGVFFWSGKFEAIGNEEEDYLIIPDLEVNPDPWLERKVIGLSGPIATGKTTAANYIKSLGFEYGRYSLVLKRILAERSIEANRTTLQDIGDEVNQSPGQRWLCKELIKLLPSQGDLVIDGLRHPDDHAFLVENFGPAFVHVHIAAPKKIREKRYVAAGFSKEEFKIASEHHVEMEIDEVSRLAHVSIRNDGDIPSLENSLLDIIKGSDI